MSAVLHAKTLQTERCSLTGKPECLCPNSKQPIEHPRHQPSAPPPSRTTPPNQLLAHSHPSCHPQAHRPGAPHDHQTPHPTAPRTPPASAPPLPDSPAAPASSPARRHSAEGGAAAGTGPRFSVVGPPLPLGGTYPVPGAATVVECVGARFVCGGGGMCIWFRAPVKADPWGLAVAVAVGASPALGGGGREDGGAGTAPDRRRSVRGRGGASSLAGLCRRVCGCCGRSCSHWVVGRCRCRGCVCGSSLWCDTLRVLRRDWIVEMELDWRHCLVVLCVSLVVSLATVNLRYWSLEVKRQSSNCHLSRITNDVDGGRHESRSPQQSGNTAQGVLTSHPSLINMQYSHVTERGNHCLMPEQRKEAKVLRPKLQSRASSALILQCTFAYVRNHHRHADHRISATSAYASIFLQMNASRGIVWLSRGARRLRATLEGLAEHEELDLVVDGQDTSAGNTTEDRRSGKQPSLRRKNDQWSGYSPRQRSSSYDDGWCRAAEEERSKEVALERANEDDRLDGVVETEVETTVDDDTGDGRHETTVETGNTVRGEGLPVDIDETVELTVTARLGVLGVVGKTGTGVVEGVDEEEGGGTSSLATILVAKHPPPVAVTLLLVTEHGLVGVTEGEVQGLARPYPRRRRYA
ncbi:ADP,ATP carrier [Hortaea werneckii]|nr:ADP,ATP carrier [Hortaea werneckii]